MLGSFAERYGLPRELALRVGCAFGGGIARTGQLCGAVSGALMVIGLAQGATEAADQDSRETTYRTTRAFCSKYPAVFLRQA